MSEYQHKPVGRSPDVEELLDYGFQPVRWLSQHGGPGDILMTVQEALAALEIRKRDLATQHVENEQAKAEGRPPKNIVNQAPDTLPADWEDDADR